MSAIPEVDRGGVTFARFPHRRAAKTRFAPGVIDVSDLGGLGGVKRGGSINIARRTGRKKVGGRKEEEQDAVLCLALFCVFCCYFGSFNIAD